MIVGSEENKRHISCIIYKQFMISHISQITNMNTSLILIIHRWKSRLILEQKKVRLISPDEFVHKYSAFHSITESLVKLKPDVVSIESSLLLSLISRISIIRFFLKLFGIWHCGCFLQIVIEKVYMLIEQLVLTYTIMCK